MATLPLTLGACASAIAALASLHAAPQAPRGVTVAFDDRPIPYATWHPMTAAKPKPKPAYKWHLPALTADQWIMAASGWCEGRSEGPDAIAATINVLHNRAKRFGTTTAEEALKPWQISCWNRDTTARATMYGIGRWIDPKSPDGIAWIVARGAAIRESRGDLPDKTHGALWYHTKAVHPAWDRDMRRVASIGAHVYFVRKAA